MLHAHPFCLPVLATHAGFMVGVGESVGVGVSVGVGELTGCVGAGEASHFVQNPVFVLLQVPVRPLLKNDGGQ